jgi:CheY-like chemotaxis protein
VGEFPERFDMKELGALLNGIAAVIWPLIAAWTVHILHPYLRALLSRDKVTIKIGEMELSAEQAGVSLSKQIIELQERMAKLERNVKEDDWRVAASIKTPPRKILWVDDNPENNAIPIQKLIQDGDLVVKARSTSEGLEIATASNFDLIISDMGRTENGNYVPDAGLLLLRALRDSNIPTPLIFLTTRGNIQNFGGQITDAKVQMAHSPIDLYGLIDSAFRHSP